MPGGPLIIAPMSSLVLGVALAAAASLLFNLGLVFQKQGAARQRGLKRLSGEWVKGYLTSRRWLAGTAITLVGYGSEFVSFAVAPFAIVQPIFSAGIASLAVLAVLVAKERFTKTEWVGVSTAAVGAALVVLTARPEVDAVSFEKVAWGRLSVVLGSAVVLAGFFYLVGLGVRRAREVVLGLASGVGFTGAEVLTKAVGVEVVHGPRRLSLALLSQPRTWVMAAGLAFFGVLGTYILQVGFEHGRALIVGGVMGLSADILPLLSGVVVFGENLAPGPLLGGLRVSGIVLAVAGASVVAFSPETEQLLEYLGESSGDSEHDSAGEQFR